MSLKPENPKSEARSATPVKISKASTSVTYSVEKSGDHPYAEPSTKLLANPNGELSEVGFDSAPTLREVHEGAECNCA